MKVNDNWIIESDESQFITKKKSMVERKVEGTELKELVEVWNVTGYHPSFEYALKHVVKKEVLYTGCKEANEIVFKLQELERMIEQLEVVFSG